MVSSSPEAPITEASIAIKACELACELLLLYSLQNGKKFIFGLYTGLKYLRDFSPERLCTEQLKFARSKPTFLTWLRYCLLTTGTTGRYETLPMEYGMNYKMCG